VPFEVVQRSLTVMNRYQYEVAQMDRRHRLAVRLLSFAGAAALAIVALWSAGLPPAQWLSSAQRTWTTWLAPEPAAQSAAVSPPTQAASPAAIAQASSDVLQGTDSSVSATPLPLYLVSTAPGRNKNEGTARIGTTVENPQTYVSGAILANGARLAEVHQDHVVLTRGKASADLYVYQRDPRAKQLSVTSPLLSVSAAPTTPLSVEKVGEGLTDYLRPSPVYDGETLRGYQVYPGSRTGVFARLGLEPGDIVTSINDAPLSEPSHALEMFAQLMRGAAVVATVERKNAVRRISLDGALISADQKNSTDASASTVLPAT
jgi:type II secretion system protein C